MILLHAFWLGKMASRKLLVLKLVPQTVAFGNVRLSARHAFVCSYLMLGIALPGAGAHTVPENNVGKRVIVRILLSV